LNAIATCLSVEASELLELYLWKKDEEVDLDKIPDELADVFYSAFLLAAHYGLDVREIVMRKLEKNREKYPVEKARGRNRKWDEM
jgi:NTP pyrophosphatase (non-canonical NTP hydrolase)